ncbi:MAG: glycosyltransferase family 39 protein [Patescibacteria group bacterium]
MKNFASDYAAVIILSVMAILLVGSAWNDSAIMDELSHISAGYSYVTELDYRINPEHPPLMKMLSAVPLLFQNISFPVLSDAWQKDVNGQWDLGRIFLYESGNDADSIIFSARVPIMILSIITGWLLFSWTRRRFGNRVGLLTLAFFAFSPTVIAHSRFVTTDLGATFAFLIGIVGLVNFLENPSWKSARYAGILFGIAQLLKFSAVLLAPIYVIVFICWLLAKRYEFQHTYGAYLKHLIPKFIFIFVVGALTIFPLYEYATWDQPPERQKHDTSLILTSYATGPKSLQEACTHIRNLSRCPAELVIAGSDKPILRAYSEYLLGVLMVTQRSSGGNTSYFLGKISNEGSHWYFPIAYALKEPLPILIMVMLAFYLSLHRLQHVRRFSWDATGTWIEQHIVEFSSLTVIAVYWLFSIKSPLNIGIRHVLPTFPFIYLLTSVQIVRWLDENNMHSKDTIVGWFKEAGKMALSYIAKHYAIAVLLLWLVLGTLFAFPNYLSYYNELVGTDNGYRYIDDSNYDWGQDLKRLKDFADDRDIQTIALDYFGGGSPKYYLGDRFVPWQSSRGPAHGWFAISASFLQGATGTPVPGLEIRPEDTYSWLRGQAPVARAGTSIFIYQLP